MTNVVVQSDNAVVDYTTIRTLIDAVNNLSTDVQQLKLENQSISTKTDANGAIIKTIGKQIIDSGSKKINLSGSSVKIEYNKTFSAIPVVTAIVQFSGKAIVPYIKNPADLTSSGATFTLSEDPGGSKKGEAYIYWIAVGTTI